MSEVLSAEGGEPRAARIEVLIGLGRLREARAECAAVAASDPENPFHYYTLARIHHGLGDYPRALEAARQAVALAPEWPFVYYVVSLCLHDLHDFAGELRAAERGGALDPEEPVLLDRLARAQMQSGLLRKARETALRLVRLRPEDADTHSLIGDLCLELNDFDTALTHVTEALRQRPEDAVLHNDLGRVHLGRKAEREAVDAFHRAVRLQPGQALFRDNLQIAVTRWADRHPWPGARKRALAALPPEVAAYYRHQQAARTPFQRLGLFGPMLIVLGALVLLTRLFSALR